MDGVVIHNDTPMPRYKPGRLRLPSGFGGIRHEQSWTTETESTESWTWKSQSIFVDCAVVMFSIFKNREISKDTQSHTHCRRETHLETVSPSPSISPTSIWSSASKTLIYVDLPCAVKDASIVFATPWQVQGWREPAFEGSNLGKFAAGFILKEK